MAEIYRDTNNNIFWRYPIKATFSGNYQIFAKLLYWHGESDFNETKCNIMKGKKIIEGNLITKVYNVFYYTKSQTQFFFSFFFCEIAIFFFFFLRNCDISNKNNCDLIEASVIIFKRKDILS